MMDWYLDRLGEILQIHESTVLIPQVLGIVWSDTFPGRVTLLTICFLDYGSLSHLLQGSFWHTLVRHHTSFCPIITGYSSLVRCNRRCEELLFQDFTYCYYSLLLIGNQGLYYRITSDTLGTGFSLRSLWTLIRMSICAGWASLNPVKIGPILTRIKFNS